MNTQHAIGIDFGTTKTIACRWDNAGQCATEIRLGRLGPIPTVLHLDPDGNFLFGDDAEDNRSSDPAGYLPRIKRHLARKKPIVLHGKPFSPEKLTTEFLRHLRIKIEEEALHGAVGHAVITVPALLGPAAKEALARAARDAGFTDFQLLEEPVAGGLSFLRDNAGTVEGTQFLVFDWGGGTLDLAVIQKRGAELASIPDLIGGDENLGGEDLDDSMAEGVSELLRSQGRRTIDQQPDEYQAQIRRLLTAGKELLSRKTTHTFRFELVDGPLEFPWTRSEFETFIAGPVESAVTTVTRFMERVRAANLSLDGLILVGGSSQIPLVQKRLGEATGLRIFKYDRSKEAVARGALLTAQARMQKSSQTCFPAPPPLPKTPPPLPEKHRVETIASQNSFSSKYPQPAATKEFLQKDACAASHVSAKGSQDKGGGFTGLRANFFAILILAFSYMWIPEEFQERWAWTVVSYLLLFGIRSLFSSSKSKK